jgi:hypothetical protein
VEPSRAVIGGLASFYEAFCSHDAERFAAALASGDGVSVIGTGPDEGHHDRESWIKTYATQIAQLGLRLEGGREPRAYAEESVGFAVDDPRFVLPDGSFLPMRLTAVLRREGDEWKVVHLHFSVGVPDEEAIRPAEQAEGAG